MIIGKTHKSEVPTLPCTEINPQTKPLNNHILIKRAQLTCLQTSKNNNDKSVNKAFLFSTNPGGDSQHSPSMKSAYLQENPAKR